MTILPLKSDLFEKLFIIGFQEFREDFKNQIMEIHKIHLGEDFLE